MMVWIIIISILFASGITSTKLENLLKRHKRWDGNGGDMSNMFRGSAGVDYPDFKSIPTTNFRCDDQIYEGGLYADVEAQCQVYHVCHDGRKDSFLCGRGTIFNQEILACDYWYSTECDKAPSFYYVNEQIGNSGSSWVPPSGGYQAENPNNFQNDNYGQKYPNNDGSSGGNSQQPTQFGSNNNGRSGGFGSSNNGQGGGFGPNNNDQNSGFRSNNNEQNGNNNKEDCCCQKYSYKTPWEFPAS